MKLYDQIHEIVVEQLNIRPDELQKDTRFKEDLHIDSLDVLGLIMLLEEKFHIDISNDNIESITTPKDAAAHIKKILRTTNEIHKNA